ncbi:MAG TPA: RNA polymerase sigma factor SigJ [Natronosporangium sp.]|jgi:RNA polymerase sigma factor (sigma-70 family)|nr:RNA polymerase sigma factor SigJ [Natronosporangium sp.]
MTGGNPLPDGDAPSPRSHPPDALRRLMFSVAYRMLGSVSDAEDVVQDAVERMHTQPREIHSPQAWAVTVTTRLAIDALRSARRRRERYVGVWLPEPWLVDEGADPARRVEQDETLSMAFLVVVETLGPVERAVFLLREVFGYRYAEIGQVVGRSEVACRQILSRARRRIAERRPGPGVSPAEQERLARRLFAAMQEGDLAGLEEVLAADVRLAGDGGGVAPARLTPIHGSLAVGRFLLGLMRLVERTGLQLHPAWVNGAPGAVVRTGDGALVSVVALAFADGRVVEVHNQLNPSKLAHLGRVGNLAALIGRGGLSPA